MFQFLCFKVDNIWDICEKSKMLKFFIFCGSVPHKSMNASAVIKMPIIGYKSDISQFLVTHLP